MFLATKNLRRLLREISNFTGWTTKRKIVIFESDDWGSIRIPSLGIREKLEKNGLGMSSVYNQFDSLAEKEDLLGLYEVLDSVKDANYQPAKFTAVSIVANPDFEKIKASGFELYYYEPFTETLKRFNLENTIPLLHEGINKNIFSPQFHGREHINANLWLEALQKGDKKTRIAFDHGVWDFDDGSKHGFLAAFDILVPEDITYLKSVLTEGCKLFENIFHYKASYFVPPNGPFNNNLNETLFENGIKYRSASKIQNEPIGYGKTRKVIHWLGQKDKSGIRYITRNCFFEPSHPGKDWVDSCLNDIKIAFRWHKPAIISSHRVNYIGALRPENRDRGLRQLNTLLKSIMKNWPDVEFMTTPELGKLIEGD